MTLGNDWISEKEGEEGGRGWSEKGKYCVRATNVRGGTVDRTVDQAPNASRYRYLVV